MSRNRDRIRFKDMDYVDQYPIVRDKLHYNEIDDLIEFYRDKYSDLDPEHVGFLVDRIDCLILGCFSIGHKSFTDEERLRNCLIVKKLSTGISLEERKIAPQSVSQLHWLNIQPPLKNSLLRRDRFSQVSNKEDYIPLIKEVIKDRSELIANTIYSLLPESIKSSIEIKDAKESKERNIAIIQETPSARNIKNIVKSRKSVKWEDEVTRDSISHQKTSEIIRVIDDDNSSSGRS